MTNFPDARLVALCPTDEAAIALFEQTPELRAEFRGGLASFAAYIRHARASASKAAAPTPASTVPATDDAARKAYAATPALQKEFRSEGAYVAWAAATRSGAARIFKGGDR